MRDPRINDIVRRDRRYAYEAYEFMFQALSHTQRMFGREPDADDEPGEEHHVSGPEIVAGAVDLARDEFGFLAREVFGQWGVNRSDDLGEIVFNLIESNLLSKTESDHRDDFRGVMDLPRALGESFPIRLGGEPATTRGSR